MPDPRKNPRCLDCGFVNPEEAKFCGLCGSPLAPGKAPRKKSKTKSNYEDSIISGEMGRAADYGYSVWTGEAWKLLGILILGCLFVSIPLIILIAAHDRLQKGFFLLLTYIAVAFVFAGLARINLDIIRGGPARLSRGIIAGFSKLLPACLMLLWLIIGSLILAGLIWLWSVPQMIIDSYERSESLSGVVSDLAAIWLIVTILIVIVPFVLMWLAGFWIGMCRVADGHAGSWSAAGWTLRRMIEHPWALIRVTLGQLWVQFLGMAFCWVGLFYTLSMSNGMMSGVYEWLKYHEVRQEECD